MYEIDLTGLCLGFLIEFGFVIMFVKDYVMMPIKSNKSCLCNQRDLQLYLHLVHQGKTAETGERKEGRK